MNNRRTTLLGLLAGLRALLAGAPAQAAQPPKVYEVTHTEAEWRKLLSSEQFNVLRKAGTERPFSSPLDKEKRTGTFQCA